MQVTPEISDVELASLSTAERASESRRDTLERLAGLCTPRAVSVSVSFVEDGACCVVDDSPGEAYEIRIPTRAYDQPGTDLPPAVWNKRVQVGLLFHELGHVLYSDFKRFHEVIDDVRPEWTPVFRTIYNAAEDAVVETQIANEFNVTNDLVLLNKTFRNLAEDRHRRFAALFGLGSTTENGDDSPVRGEYTVLEGLKVGILDRGFTHGDRFAQLVDPTDPTRQVRDGREDVLREFEPALVEYVATMLAEPDGTERVEIAARFFEQVRDRLDPLPTIQHQPVEQMAVRPQDADTDTFGASRRATALPDSAQAREYVRDGCERAAHAGAEGASTATTTSGDTDTDGDRSRLPPGAVAQRELRQRARQAGNVARRRSDQSTATLEAAAKSLRRFVRDESTGVERIGIGEESDTGDAHERWANAQRRARQLAADLDAKLRRRRRTRFEGGRRTGRVDSSRVTNAVRGDNRVFQRRTGGDERDYTCLIVLDRSGSMDGARLEAAEQAVGQLLSAFSEADVDTGLLSLYESLPYLEVPVGGDPANHVRRFMRQDACGTTPLSETLAAAKSLLDTGRGAVPLVFVVTDGEPDSTDAYRDELAACSFPVYGVYVDPDADGDPEYFDSLVITDATSVDRDLRALVRSLFRSG